MSSNHVVNALFEEFQRSLTEEQDIRESIRTVCKEIDQISREVTTVLQVIHHDETGIMVACQKSRELFSQAKLGYEKLKGIVPANEYYRYHDHWRFMTQRYCYLIALTIWLEMGILATQDTIASILGIGAEQQKTGFHLDVEDFLIGLLQMSSELYFKRQLGHPVHARLQARLAVNAVTRGDYNKPLQISKFVMELNAGFRLLNLKNDHLRKRFDALKYDVKKIEEVVYDLSIRGLLPKSEPAEVAA